MRAREAMWRTGAPVRALLIALVHVYRATFSGVFGGQCRFYPSCSHFAEDAIRAHGAVRGSGLAIWRVLRCNPFGRGGIDRVPPHVLLHDAVIRDHEMTGA
jgi:putative membrane protein insertion efficiency factor